MIEVLARGLGSEFYSVSGPVDLTSINPGGNLMYTIVSEVSDIELGEYPGDTPTDAVAYCLQDAGYTAIVPDGGDTRVLVDDPLAAGRYRADGVTVLVESSIAICSHV